MGPTSFPSFAARPVLLSGFQNSSSARLRLDRSTTPANTRGLWCRDAAPRDQVSDVSTRFGRRLRLLRHERQMTQLDMATRFGIDRSYISEVERGRKSMTLAMLEVIALGMDISLSKLFENM